MHERAIHGRRLARALLVTAFAIVGLVAILGIAQPNFIGPMVTEPPRRLPISEVGVVGILVGLVWMIRIDRAVRDPERHRPTWRFNR